MNRIISWIHFGDLHLSGRKDRNYRDFLLLIEEANRSMRSGIAFALLPGDNADDGEEEEYELVHSAISKCLFPVHAIAGDHDIAAGTLEPFRKYLSDAVHRSFSLGGYRFVLLNSVANWHPPAFGLGADQMAWLQDELRSAGSVREPVVVFLHAYPAEHGPEADELRAAFHKSGVLLIEMGHTHYNELANDGQIIYAATRSTGQIEEGPCGFSVTTLDDGLVSWKFKPLGEWPFVMITSPSDERLIVDRSSPAQVVRGEITIHARVWGGEIETVTLSVDDGNMKTMKAIDDCTWSTSWDSTRHPDGSHVVTVAARTLDDRTGSDRIAIRVHQQGRYQAPVRHPVDYENAIGEWPEKHILGTQLGPNENGRHWPSRRERLGK